jgi:hypothetical protein
MKLSDAIIAGQKLGVPQGRGRYFKYNHVEDSQFCACAMGQALLGAGVVSVDEAAEWPGRVAATDKAQAQLNLWRPHLSDVVYWNDVARMSLDQIVELLQAQGL